MIVNVIKSYMKIENKIQQNNFYYDDNNDILSKQIKDKSFNQNIFNEINNINKDNEDEKWWVDIIIREVNDLKENENKQISS